MQPPSTVAGSLGEHPPSQWADDAAVLLLPDSVSDPNAGLREDAPWSAPSASRETGDDANAEPIETPHEPQEANDTVDRPVAHGSTQPLQESTETGLPFSDPAVSHVSVNQVGTVANVTSQEPSALPLEGTQHRRASESASTNSRRGDPTGRPQAPPSSSTRGDSWSSRRDTHAVTSAQMECLAGIAYMVGSPLQQHQPTAVESLQPSLLLACHLLEQGVDPERIIQVIEARNMLW